VVAQLYHRGPLDWRRREAVTCTRSILPGMDIPGPVLHPMQAKFFGDLRRRHHCTRKGNQTDCFVQSQFRELTTVKVLLVRENHEQTIPHLPIRQNSVELLPCFIYTIPILRIDNEYQTLAKRIGKSRGISLGNGL